MAEPANTTTLSRRNVLRTLASAPVAAMVTSGAITAAFVHDPITDAIAAYRAGMASYEVIHEKDWAKHGGEGVVVETTYGAPMRVLEEWSEPAVTREGAIEALRVVVDEVAGFWSTPMVGTMVMAALAYLENQTD